MHPLLPERTVLLIVSGPAGAGKTTVCDRLLAEEPHISRVVTATTRAPRDGEADGDDYHFFDPGTFAERVAQDAFYEHAEVHGHAYGTLKSEVRTKLEAGEDLLLNIDVQGAASLRQAAREDPALQGRLVSAFIMPPSFEDLEERLRSRGADDDEAIQRRLRAAQEEIGRWREYDYCVRSTTRWQDYERLHSIYRAEKVRVTGDTLGEES